MKSPAPTPFKIHSAIDAVADPGGDDNYCLKFCQPVILSEKKMYVKEREFRPAGGGVR